MVNEKNKKLITNTMIFGLGNLGSKLISMLIVPLCTFYINTEGMGMYDLLLTIVQLIMPVAMMGVSESLFRWLLDKDYSQEEVISNWMKLFSPVITSFSLVYFGATLIWKFDYSWIIYSLIVTGCIYTSIQYGTRGLKNNKLFALQGILYAFIIAAFDVLFVIVLRFGFEGLLYANLIANVLVSVIALIKQPIFLSQRVRNTSISKDLKIQMIKYSLYLIPNMLSWWIMQGSGRLIISLSIGVAANGIFAISMKFPSIINMLTSVFQMAWQEQSITEFSCAEKDVYFSSVFKNYSKLLISALLIIIPASQLFIVYFTDQSYVDSSKYVSFLLLGGVFNAFASFLGTGYLASMDTKGAFMTTVFGAIANLLIAIGSVKWFGLLGVSLAFMLANFIIWIVRVAHVKKHYVVSINWKYMSLALTCMLAFSVITAYAAPQWRLLFLVFGCVIFAIVNKNMIVKSIDALRHGTPPR